MQTLCSARTAKDAWDDDGVLRTDGEGEPKRIGYQKKYTEGTMLKFER